MRRALLVLVLCLAVSGASADVFTHGRVRPQPISSRLSDVVAFVYSGTAVTNFLNAPAQSFVQASFMFPQGFPSDAFAVMDQEFLDGTNSPLYVSAGDWMGYIQIQQNGTLWVGTGPTPGTSPTATTWVTFALSPFQLGQRYTIRTVVDLSTRKWVNFQVVSGPNNVGTTDLSAYNINLVQLFQIDQRAETYYVGATRNMSYQASAGTPDGFPVVIWDNVSGGIPGTPDTVLWTNAFDAQSVITLNPYIGQSPPFAATSATHGQWYLERDTSLFSVAPVPYAFSGRNVGLANATLYR